MARFAELSCQKIVFDLQLADLPVQNVNLCFAGRPSRGRVRVFEKDNSGSPSQWWAICTLFTARRNADFLGDTYAATHVAQATHAVAEAMMEAIGVGQYQHDLSEQKLSRSLDAVVEDCVNAVGACSLARAQ
jgi:uncharacterized protein